MRVPTFESDRCAHGYPVEQATRECPRCADRPIAFSRTVRPSQTRWHGTDTTLGPRWKVAITVALVAPLLVMIFAIRRAGANPEYAFLALPIGGLALFTARFLPHLWEAGQQSSPNGSGPSAGLSS
jgi:hypothetical protein